MRATVRTTAVATLAVITAWLAPSTALAQTPAARVVLYEVTESLKPSDPPGHRHYYQTGLARLANASLLSIDVVTFGSTSPFGGVRCPADPPTCYMTAVASSAVSLTSGTGPISGTFDVEVLQPDPSGRHLSDLVIVASGHLSGTLDLRPAFAALANGTPPYAPVSGEWTVGDRDHESHHHSHGSSPYQGWFLIPFEAPREFGLPPGLYYLQDYALASPSPIHLSDDTCASGKLYGDPHSLRLCQLDPWTESVLGFPLTKAVIFLEN